MEVSYSSALFGMFRLVKNVCRLYPHQSLKQRMQMQITAMQIVPGRVCVLDKFPELLAIVVTKASSDILGERDIRKCPC
jgi:hypothetical protein